MDTSDGVFEGWTISTDSAEKAPATPAFFPSRGPGPGVAPPRAPGEPLEQAPRGVLGQLLERYGMEDVSGDLVVHGEHR